MSTQRAEAGCRQGVLLLERCRCLLVLNLVTYALALDMNLRCA